MYTKASAQDFEEAGGVGGRIPPPPLCRHMIIDNPSCLADRVPRMLLCEASMRGLKEARGWVGAGPST